MIQIRNLEKTLLGRLKGEGAEGSCTEEDGDNYTHKRVNVPQWIRNVSDGRIKSIVTWEKGVKWREVFWK